MNVLVIGTGEYVTGFGSHSDKSAGVIALTLFDLRARGLVNRIGLLGRRADRFADIRSHFQELITRPYGLDASFEEFVDKPEGFDAVIVVTPDDTHHALALAALRAGQHVLVAKPLVHTLAEQLELVAAADGLVVAGEYHKRFDPFYADARDRARELGDFSFLSSYMSQPASQLDTFRSWAGLSSDISYYLNSHHVDFHAWTLEGRARPVRVSASASSGVACTRLGRPCEDTITLSVEWENLPSGNPGHAVYTASWIAPPGDVHSQQQFRYLAHGGELQVDQAHRGFIGATATGQRSLNPLFMKYTPSNGRFAGQHGYGYRSIEVFLESARTGVIDPRLATAASTLQVTAVLEAGRLSLDRGSSVRILYPGDSVQPQSIRCSSSV
jgi:D-galacturonate reductase